MSWSSQVSYPRRRPGMKTGEVVAETVPIGIAPEVMRAGQTNAEPAYGYRRPRPPSSFGQAARGLWPDPAQSWHERH